MLSLPQQGGLGDNPILYWTIAGNIPDKVEVLKRVDNDHKT